MESLYPLAIESFSKSWLISLSSARSSLDTYQDSTRPSIDINPHDIVFFNNSENYTRQRSKRIIEEEAQNFNFDVPNHPQYSSLVHADQLFSDGLIKPVFVKHPIAKTHDLQELTVPIMPASSSGSGSVPAIHIHCHSFGIWRKKSERIWQKCIARFRPVCYKVRGTRKSVKIDDINRKTLEFKSMSNSPQASPTRISTAFSTESDHVIQSSIYEAVLHCKRSVDKEMVEEGEVSQR